MMLKAGETLDAWPRAGYLAVEEAMDPHHIADAPKEMPIAGDDECHAGRLVSARKPDAMIALVIADGGMQAVGSQLAAQAGSCRVRKCRSSKAVRRVCDNHSGRE